MKTFSLFNAPCVYLEIGQSTLKALDGDAGFELPLERQENGRLTARCVENLSSRLRAFLQQQRWQPRRRAVCAIGARGVSLRRLTLPAASKEELQRLLLLQIEREFPLPPDELAWGFRPLNQERLPRNGGTAAQELFLVAVRKEVLREYSEILSGCGLSAVFTLGALARSALCRQPPGSFSVLDIGRSHSELVFFDNGAPSAIRILPWGGEDLTHAIEKGLGISHDEAEKVKVRLEEEPASSEELRQKTHAAIGAELNSLAGSIQGHGIGRKLFLTGESARLKNFAPLLARALGDPAECERMEVAPGAGRSAAILGLKRSCEEDGAAPLLVLQLAPSRNGETVARPASWKWAALAGLLVVCSLSLRYAEVLFQKPRLARRLAEIKGSRDKLPQIDRELSFLQYLKTNQPPYLDAISILANSAAPGTRPESLSMTRRGDLSLRAGVRDPQQIVEFRSKLIDSGFFSTVVVEEQTPTPDRQKVVVRMSGQWKPPGERKPFAAEVPRAELGKSRPPMREGKPGSSPLSVEARAGRMTNDQ